jgi:aspartate-semialdehyde dehydrogenase
LYFIFIFFPTDFVGATGLVGSVMIKVLEERGFQNMELIPAASSKSVGKKIKFANKELDIVSVEEAIASSPDIAIFSAGSAASLKYAPLFAEKGTVVIDNSSAWRMFDYIPLLVPQINGSILTKNDKIMANPMTPLLLSVK